MRISRLAFVWTVLFGVMAWVSLPVEGQSVLGPIAAVREDCGATLPPAVVGAPCPDLMPGRIRDAIKDKLNIYSKAPRISEQEMDLMTIEIMEGWNRYGLPPSMILSIIETESSFNYRIISHHGAIGLMQIMPKYAKRAFMQLGLKESPKRVLLTPHLNIRVGVVMLSNFRLATNDKYADCNMTITAYNGGEVMAHRVYSRKGHTFKTIYASRVHKHVAWYRERDII